MLRHYLMLLSTTLHHCNYPGRLSSPLGLQSIPCPHTCTSHTTTAATIPPPSSKCLQAAHMSLSFTTVGHEHIASCCKHITGMSQHQNRGWGSADGLGGVHTCAHAAGPAAAEERANSTRRPAEYCARCDRARGKPLQHCDGQAGPHASIQGTCSEHRLSCRCSHEGVGIPGWLWSGLGG